MHRWGRAAKTKPLKKACTRTQSSKRNQSRLPRPEAPLPSSRPTALGPARHLAVRRDERGRRVHPQWFLTDRLFTPRSSYYSSKQRRAGSRLLAATRPLRGRVVRARGSVFYAAARFGAPDISLQTTLANYIREVNNKQHPNLNGLDPRLPRPGRRT